MGTIESAQSGQETAKHGSGRGKFHVDYWRRRIYQKTFTRDGERHVVPEWSVRLQHQNRREAFALGTINAVAAAAKAKEIATYLDANGWTATLETFKPSAEKTPEFCTVGEFLQDVSDKSHLKPATIGRYAVKLRKLVADVAKIDSGLRGRARGRKFDHASGGRAAWLADVEQQPLAILTPAAVREWRNRYVARAGHSDPMKRKSAERSAASIMRNARALFSAEVLAALKVNVPPNPFAGVKLKDPGPQRYRSDVNPEWLLACARNELLPHRPNTFLALFLCLCAGLRRKEADLLLWEQVDFRERQVHVRRTEFFEPKTDESERSIDLSEATVEMLRAFRHTSGSEFVLLGNNPHPDATYPYYRSDHTWRELVTWLRSKGVRQRAANHTLRKESGSLIAAEFGIEAARQHLGHRDIRTTSAHYISKKRRFEVHLSGADLLPGPSAASAV